MSDSNPAKFTAMTVEEACATYGGEGRRELIEGEFVEMTPASRGHDWYTDRALEALYLWKQSLPSELRKSVLIASAEGGWQLAENIPFWCLTLPHAASIRRQKTPPPQAITPFRRRSSSRFSHRQTASGW